MGARTERVIQARPSGPSPGGIWAAAVTLAVAATAARAADPNVIAVAGTATVKGPPSTVVIVASMSGEAELAADAAVKFGDLKKKATAALAALGNRDLTVEPQGSSVDQAMDPAQQQRMMQGMGGDAGKQKVQMTEQVKLVLHHVDGQPPEKVMATVLKVLDAARDAGLQVGPPPPRNWYEMQMQNNNGTAGGAVSFRIPDVTSLQDKAYRAAMDDARRRAQRLADLTGVKLGRVVSAQDQGAGPTSADVRAMAYATAGGEAVSAVSTEASSTTLADIPVTVKLFVQFEIQK